MLDTRHGTNYTFKYQLYRYHSQEADIIKYEHFGEYFVALRVKHGYTSQRSLSIELGISNSTIARIERGESEPTAETLEKVAELFKINLEELIETKNQYRRGEVNSLHDKLSLLNKKQLYMITGIVDEFLRMGGK